MQEYYYCYNNEVELLQALKSGDGTAVKAVFSKYFRPLCQYAEKLTGRLESAEDIVADTFVKLWHRREQFESLENVRHFLYRVARNAALNELRNEGRHQATHTELGNLYQEAHFSAEDLEEEEIRAELLAEIYQEVENLPDKCREIFKLLFFNGLSTEEVSIQLGIMPQTVRNQKSRAIQLLRAQLLKKGHLLAAWSLLFLLPHS
ncbi:RNA polymerase sigma-70 factor (ECF subfamily) [Chitinophaga polysaccharea]|uniref:RNA polymerase sigma-70 factor (ECF subfamily) n=1 Tax=Chitinophaga polysaccharea TaxID=1293035 RepID=A0A561Q5T3_9BACT|nr:RNA polymerase sigma-70 factor [Chitinophaga polysaccharea]TWF45722.1 RNA polymerase sigma-70 factor (ECF subfamily) [Chitinophaga polysaccharea]